jgi:kumamolisin
VKDFNETFATTLHICLRKNPQAGNPPFLVYCTLTSFTLPKFVAERTTGLLTADLPAAVGALPGEAGVVMATRRGRRRSRRVRSRRAYEIDDLYAAGLQRAGADDRGGGGGDVPQQGPADLLEVVRDHAGAADGADDGAGDHAHHRDDPRHAVGVVDGAGGGGDHYEGPDARNTALLFVFNEAIALNEVTVLTDSFAHREDSEPLPLRHQYDHSALMAAALGITVVSASGDSGRPTPVLEPVRDVRGRDRPGDRPAGNVQSEVAWFSSGSGDEQDVRDAVVAGGHRAGDQAGGRRRRAQRGRPVARLLGPAVRQLAGLRRDLVLGAGVRGDRGQVNSYRESKGQPPVGF